MDNFDEGFYTRYPKVGVTADHYGFNELDIDLFMGMVRNDPTAQECYRNDNEIELMINIILVRVGIKRYDFYEHLKMSKVPSSLDEFVAVRLVSGLQAMAAYIALIKYFK